MPREPVAGPEHGPETPFPIKLSGQIIKGFGRGSKDLGIPTANIPIEGLDVGGYTDITSGVYFGFAGISFASIRDDGSKQLDPEKGFITLGAAHVEKARADVYPMVMSIGWNPVYKNEKRSVEVHLIHEFKEDFYGALMNLSILGFIRPEADYDSLDALIADIKTDTDVARASLDRPAYAKLKNEPFLRDWDWAASPQVS